MSTTPEPRWRILNKSNLGQLKKQARELLNGYRACASDAVDLVHQFHPDPPSPEKAKLSDIQLTMARAYDYPSWPRLKHGVEIYNAIWDDDEASVMALIRRHPSLLRERVNGVTSNWGPPLSCAVQLGSVQVFNALLPMAGQDLDWALDRAVLKGRTEMAKALMERGVVPAPGTVMGPCETLNIEGLNFLKTIGAPLTDEQGDPMAPVAMLLEGYFRQPKAKHACLDFFAQNGVAYPDTPVLALHLGRIDLLEKHLKQNPALLSQRFSYRDIYPLELGCHEDVSLGLHGTPLDGTTLLHMAVDFDEFDIAVWLMDRGADVNCPALIDSDGFGGHTALYNAVVSQAYRCGRQADGALAKQLLDGGSRVNATASIRKGIRFIADESIHEYRDVTPFGYGSAFHAREWVNPAAMRLISKAGGK